MGEGKMWDPRTGESGEASAILATHGLEAIRLGAKEVLG